jgi:hypothetical protein
MKTFLVHEGPNDLAFMRAILPRLSAVKPTSIISKTYSTLISLNKGVSGEDVLITKAESAALLAEVAGCELVIFIHDVDAGGGGAHEVNARKAHDEVVALMRKGAANAGANIIFVTAAPCRMLEAWVLADLCALGRLSHGFVESANWHFASPAVLPPQDTLKEVVKICLGRKQRSQDYEQLAAQADLGVLRARSFSFAAMADQLAALQESVTSIDNLPKRT